MQNKEYASQCFDPFLNYVHDSIQCVSSICCPIQNMPSKEFLKSFEHEFSHIEDRSITKEAISSLDLLIKFYSIELIKYEIIDNKIYTLYDQNKHNDNGIRYKMFTTKMYELSQKITLPNITFLVSVVDGMTTEEKFYKILAQLKNVPPIFVFSKLDLIPLTEKFVLIPDDHLFGDPEVNYIPQKGLENWLTYSLDGVKKYPEWNIKKEKLLWRGKPWSMNCINFEELVGYIDISRCYTSTRSKITALSEKLYFLDVTFSSQGDHTYVSTTDSAAYKYVVDIDGIAATYPGFSAKMALNSLVIKINGVDTERGSSMSTWLTPILQNNTDFLLLPSENLFSPMELSYTPAQNLMKTLIKDNFYLDGIKQMNNLYEFLLSNNNHIKEIAENSSKLAIETLNPCEVDKYMVYVLTQWSKKLDFNTEKPTGVAIDESYFSHLVLKKDDMFQQKYYSLLEDTCESPSNQIQLLSRMEFIQNCCSQVNDCYGKHYMDFYLELSKKNNYESTLLSTLRLKNADSYKASSISAVPQVLHYVYITDVNDPKSIDRYKGMMTTSILSIPNFKIKFWSNVSAGNIFFNENDSIITQRLEFENIDTLKDYADFQTFFESDIPYIQKSDLARLLIVREKGGLYCDLDYTIIRDITHITSQYDQMFTLERYYMPLIANGFFSSIAYGPIINAIFDQVKYNLNLDGSREIEKNSLRDYPDDAGSKTMMHIGPIAFTESIYNKITECGRMLENNDCGEYAVFSWGVFLNEHAARESTCPIDRSSTIMDLLNKGTCTDNSYLDHNYETLYGYDPLSSGWSYLHNSGIYRYVYNKSCSKLYPNSYYDEYNEQYRHDLISKTSECTNLYLDTLEAMSTYQIQELLTSCNEGTELDLY